MSLFLVNFSPKGRKHYLNHWTSFIGGTLLLLCPIAAHAAYQRGVAWTEMECLELGSVERIQFSSLSNLYDPSVTSTRIKSVMNDPEHRVKDFKIPIEIRNDVGFWFKVYTEYSSRQILIFDSSHLNLIYTVIDLDDPAESDNTPLNKVKISFDKYKNALLSLANRSSVNRRFSYEETEILRKVKRLKIHTDFLVLAKGLKTQRGQRDNLIEGLIEEAPFLSKMEEIFRGMGLPLELTRLCLVESLFNSRALSKVGALGVWQFMPASAKKYLMMDSVKHVDERLSPLKATIAAGKLLQWNYSYFGDWILAIIAYNHGLKNLPVFDQGKTKFSKISYLFRGEGSSPALGFASRNYYSEFLAMVYIEAYRENFYGNLPDTAVKSVGFRQLGERQTGLGAALTYGISIEEFRVFNADVQDLQRPLPKGFWIAVPGEKDGGFPS